MSPRNSGGALGRLSWGRRRNVSSPLSPMENYPTEQQFRHLHRSISESSPISPLGTDLRTPVDEYGRRPPNRSRSNSYLRYHEEVDATNPWQPYDLYQPEYHTENTPRSAPSAITSFPYDVSGPVPHPHTSTTWPLPSDPIVPSMSYSAFSPSTSVPHDPWAFSSTSTLSRQQTEITSPTDYAGLSQADVWELSTSFVPSMAQRFAARGPPPQTGRRSSRRESEAVEFTSPNDFALFVEATSSLNITPAFPTHSLGFETQQPSNFPATPYYQQTRVSLNRLAAPLPPIPQYRSHSSPAPATRRPPAHQSSRSQLLAEALAGVELQDLENSEDDDELPNYEQSQAEAGARQRQEAARRAQELNEAWSAARRRRM